ncbi:MAG: YceI family protein [Candidatus Limnocylindria bacterium]|nr:YceI family protein [Candidatus Limnocylindria bacterium]
MSHARLVASALLVVTLVAACGGAAAPTANASPLAPPTVAASAARTAAPTAAASAAPSAVATVAPSAAPAAPAGAITWSLGADKAKITIRVREQLGNLPAPSDAVFATSMSGSFALNPDGTFAPASKLTADVAALKSDQANRDRFVKNNTLQTDKFPTAVFVATKTSGLGLPLAAAGEFSFKLTGRMTIHGVDKELTFDVKAKRTGAELVATAVLNPTVKFGDFGMKPPAAPVVLSVVDEIRMEIELTGTEVK